MPTGRVKFFSAVMGFGVIAPDDGTSDIVLSAPAVDAAGLSGLNVGDEISYELQEGSRFGMPLAVITSASAGRDPA